MNEVTGDVVGREGTRSRINPTASLWVRVSDSSSVPLGLRMCTDRQFGRLSARRCPSVCGPGDSTST